MTFSITLIIIIVTAITSFIAFSQHALIDRLVFWPYRVWKNNEWYRLLSCGFIHADLGHLFFNMFALYGFGIFVESAFAYHFGGAGTTLFLLMYFFAIATADIYNLFKRRNDYGYRSLGASGGVSAVIFAAILFNPMGGISIMFLPGIPAFIFGPLYLAYCIYMAKRGQDNIGHIAHFTGAIIGFIFPVILKPHLFIEFVIRLTPGQ